jgi:hypothetical protein
VMVLKGCLKVLFVFKKICCYCAAGALIHRVPVTA